MMLPKISIVTPSYNQGEYLEETILSVLDQQYPNLEYIIIDGGSTDGSVDIIKKYAKHLAYWVSEPDRGQYDAINKGFLKSTGEIMGWINSDDKHTPWTLNVVADIFNSFPDVEWLTSNYPLNWDARGLVVNCGHVKGYSKGGFYKGGSITGRGWFSTGYIQQESTFWGRKLWERAGGRIDTSLKLAGDFELWTRFWKYGELYGVNTPLAGFRMQKKQKTATQLAEYEAEAEACLRKHGGKPYSKIESAIKKYFLQFLPSPGLSFFANVNLAYLVKNIAYDKQKGGWKVIHKYTV